MSLLRGVRVALSGSIPHPDEPQLTKGWDELGFRIFVSNLVTSVLDLGGTIVYGSHPTFQPFVENAGRAYGGRDRQVTMFFIKSFCQNEQGWHQVQERHGRYADVEPIGDFSTPREASLPQLAIALSANSHAFVCLGGRQIGFSLNELSPQVIEEVKQAEERKLAIFPIGACGGVSRQVLEEYCNRLGDLRNGLTDGQNGRFANDLTPWEASALVLSGLLTLSKLNRRPN